MDEQGAGWTEISRQVEAEYQCLHDETALRGRHDILGRPHVVRQCVTCGANLGAVAKAALQGQPFESVPSFDEETHDRYWQRIRAEKDRRWKAQQTRRKAEYSAYLQTDHWRTLRARVLQRDNSLCQGCLVQRATEVHHLTYAHRGHEMAFELVSLCRQCHEALSADADVAVS